MATFSSLKALGVDPGATFGPAQRTFSVVPGASAMHQTLSGYVGSTTQRGLRAQRQIDLTRQAADQRYQEQQSSRAARVRGASIRAAGQIGAASMRAQRAVTASSRLLAQFEAEKLQRDAIRERETSKAVGQVEGAFAASGVQSAGAVEDAKRGETAKSNLLAVQGATKREQILESARAALTGAAATGVQAGAGVAAASQFGQLFQRDVNEVNPYLFSKGKVSIT